MGCGVVSGSLREPRIRAIIEDLGCLVLKGPGTREYTVRREGTLQPTATYTVHEDGAFRRGVALSGDHWVDCLDDFTAFRNLLDPQVKAARS